MEAITIYPSITEIFVIAVGFAVAFSGIRAKWRYASQVRDIQTKNLSVDLNESKIKVRVRRLAILYIICLLGMAFSLTVFIVNKSSAFSFIALVFAGVGAATHFLIALDTSIK